ncbi:efflux RND transporter periplasmic adaptor subunit [Agarilytica rhodophyticola]|uniref:efflux RND transporter periplasmic adaptor subunit n=1 Tax=Agarilytica rhodophyticola TaxID=1737490 RepID=UPI000B348D6A|nr:efflux RND transporter periplasmic adaptor subunit [Agarilytica rhodophyticola]
MLLQSSFVSHGFKVGLMLIIVCLLNACTKKEEASSNKEIVRPIKMITVETAGAREIARFPAVIGANRLSELSLQVGGRLEEFPIKEAQSLKRGDLIAKLDQRDFNSSLASAKAQYKNAEDEYQRAVRLSEEDAIARTVLEQRRAQRDISKAQLDSAEKALADSTLRAPYDGIVAQTTVERLATVSPGQVLVVLMGEELLKATIDLPANFLARIPKEESESEKRKVFVILDVAPDQPIEAEFEEAELLADTASQTYAITFTFPPPANLNVFPGMNATIELSRESEKTDTRVAVPLSSISSDGEQQYVWIVDRETMTVSKRQVKVEDGVGDTQVIIEGLKQDDVIAGAGAAYLSEGMKIREWN